MSIKKFMTIFDGLKEAYGYFKIESTGSNGKAKGKAGVLKSPRTTKLWESHLKGGGTGLVITSKKQHSTLF